MAMSVSKYTTVPSIHTRYDSLLHISKPPETPSYGFLLSLKDIIHQLDWQISLLVHTGIHTCIHNPYIPSFLPRILAVISCIQVSTLSRLYSTVALLPLKLHMHVRTRYRNKPLPLSPSWYPILDESPSKSQSIVSD